MCSSPFRSRVNVRQVPSHGYAVSEQLQWSHRIIVDAFSTGGKLSGSNQWAHLSAENECRDLGFVHGRLLR